VPRPLALFCLLLALCGVPRAVIAGGGATEASDGAPRRVRVAVATNFASCLQELAADFTAATGIEVVASSAATGILFAQIEAGAPFDVFLAADERRPQALVADGLADGPSRFTYAVGRLVLWIPGGTAGWRPACPADSLAGALRNLLADDARPLAVASPRHAPYGRAAEQVLAAFGLQTAAGERLAVGLNVGQAWQYAATRNAAAGFVALSQLRAAALDDPGWSPGEALLVPESLHEPIVQQAVLLNAAADAAAARAFLAYLAGGDALPVLARFGYQTASDATP